MSFEDSLAEGVLAVPWCASCNAPSWPPSSRCRRCAGSLKMRTSSGRGRIAEYSGDTHGYFCLAEFEEGVCIICRITGIGTPKRDSAVILERCGRDGDGCFFDVRLEQVIPK